VRLAELLHGLANPIDFDLLLDMPGTGSLITEIQRGLSPRGLCELFREPSTHDGLRWVGLMAPPDLLSTEPVEAGISADSHEPRRPRRWFHLVAQIPQLEKDILTNILCIFSVPKHIERIAKYGVLALIEELGENSSIHH